jgi:hypothetical protein
MQTENSLQCPSYVAKPGAELFGVVNKEGKVEYLNQPIKVDKNFIDEGKKVQEKTGLALEERFRFSGKCIQGGCHQWSSEHSACSLVGKVMDAMNKKAEAALGPCPIRTGCRWFAQAGASACANCDEVVRNVEQRRLETAGILD